MNKYILSLIIFSAFMGAFNVVQGMGKLSDEKLKDLLVRANIESYIEELKNTSEEALKFLPQHLKNLSSPAVLNQKDSADNILLITAASLGKGRIVQLLINAGANIEASSKRGTALSVAASFNPHNIWKDWNPIDDPMVPLLRAGANVEAKTNYGSTPLFIALESNYIPNIQKLIEAGANITAVVGGKSVIEQARDANKQPVEKYLAVIFTISPQDIDTVVKENGGRDSRISNEKLYAALLENKIALAKKYNPKITKEQLEAGRKMLIESFERMLNKPLAQQKSEAINQQNVKSVNMGVKPMDLSN